MLPVKALALFVAAVTALPTAAVVGAVGKRDDAFSEFQEDIEKIHEKSGKIIQGLPGCDNIFCASRLKDKADDIKEIMKEGTDDLEDSPNSKFSSSQATQVISLLDGSLEQDLTGILHGVEQHPKLLTLKSRVRPYLEDLKSTIQHFGAALVMKMPDDENADEVRKEMEGLEGEADSAIKAYSK